MADALVRSLVVKRDEVEDFDAYPFSIPAIHELDELALDPRVTFFAGENGSGKSTLTEAIAIAAGLNAEGGSRHMRLATHESQSSLHTHVRLVKGTRRIRDGYFLRAESFFNVATRLDQMSKEQGGGGALQPYGGRSLHAQSHGESFLALVGNRFGPQSFFVLDEPEAALSVRGVLALMRRMHDLVAEGSQFVISTHSPILLGYPGATIYFLSERGIAKTPYASTEVVELTRSFLADRDAFLHHLFADD
jgi:predicted ATPase